MQKLCKCVLFCLGLMSGERELTITREVERDAPPLMCIGWIGSDTSPESPRQRHGRCPAAAAKARLQFILRCEQLGDAEGPEDPGGGPRLCLWRGCTRCTMRPSCARSALHKF
jgi:hypothetical protein